MTNPLRWLAAPLAAIAIAASAPTHAQVQRSGGGELQKIMQQYQQVAAEKTALQAQVEQMKKEQDTAKADLTAVKKERDTFKVRAGGAAATTAAVAQLKASKESAEKNVEIFKQRMNELVGRFRETVSNLREVEADRTKLHNELEERTAVFDKCAENNSQLYEITNEVLDRYGHVNLFTKASATEPFTRITRTRIENLVDDYRAQALENRTQKHRP